VQNSQQEGQAGKPKVESSSAGDKNVRMMLFVIEADWWEILNV
jgi:hypothetical protein